MLPPPHAPDVRLRLLLHEDVPAELLHPTAALLDASAKRSAPAKRHFLSRKASSRKAPAAEATPAVAADTSESIADHAWRPHVPAARALVRLALLGVIPAAAIAVARAIAASRQPSFAFIGSQIVAAILFVTFLLHWFRSGNLARTFCTLTCATTATVLATPALVCRLYPDSVSPEVEYEGILASSCVGLVLVLAATPPLLVAMHQAWDEACDVTARVALTTGAWLALVTVLALGGAPAWLRPPAFAALSLAAGLLFFAAFRSARDARLFGSITRGEDARFRIIAEPREALTAPPALVPVADDEARAWLVRLDTSAPTPYRTPSVGVPLAVVPVPAKKALERLRRRGTASLVIGSLTLVLAAARAAWPGPAALTQIALGDMVSVRTTGGDVNTTVADLDRFLRIRRGWQRFATPGPVAQVAAGSSGTWALASPFEILHLVADAPPLDLDTDPEQRLVARRWMPFTDPAPEPLAELTVGRERLFARTQTGSVLVWSPPEPPRRHLVSDDAPLSGPDTQGRWHRVEGLHDVAALAADGLACALHKDGRASCWIATGASAIGLGPAAPRTVLREPVGTQIAAGKAHACAAFEDGTVHCWGENNEGQLGRSPQDPSTGIGTVSGLERVVEVRARGDVTCARRADLRVFCWGKTDRGVTEPGPPEVPRELKDLPDVVRFEADEHGVCGIRPSGRLACFPRRTAPGDTP